MDSGQVIPGLNQSWTLGGAKVMEWMSGFLACIIFQELFLDSASRSMPIVMAIWVLTTYSLAAMRRSFPDEEIGLRNKLAVTLGVCPPNLPPPSQLPISLWVSKKIMTGSVPQEACWLMKS